MIVFYGIEITNLTDKFKDYNAVNQLFGKPTIWG